MAKRLSKKASHGALADFGYVFGTIWKENRKSALFIIIMAFLLPVGWVITPFINKYAVEVIAGPAQRMQSIKVLAFLLLLSCIVEMICKGCIRYNRFYGDTRCSWTFIKKLVRKRITMDYQNVETTSAGDGFQKALDGLGAVNSTDYMLRRVCSNLIQVIIYTVVLAALSPVMILVSGVPAVFCFLINHRVFGWQWRNADKWTGLDRKLLYIPSIFSDFAYAKDIRLYRMAEWLEHKFEIIWKMRKRWYAEYDRRRTLWRMMMQCISTASLLTSYGVTIYMVLRGSIGAGDFVLYFSAIQKYESAIWDLADALSGFRWYRDQINYYREYLELPDKFNHGAGAPLPEGEFELELRHVCYTYPNAEHPTINDISFTLHRGERIALVGLNGAGKSTLIKLICGLYDVTEGEILLNGTNIKKFNREEYYQFFSTVFQDFDILPVTIAQNITRQFDTDADGQGVAEVLKKAGLYDKVQSLPRKENTLLAKSVYDEATDFSGGEMQKLALAKSLYKDAPVLLLDEPTAALDAISEQEMYLQYAGFGEEKASIFISHRLASTRFCDHIIFMEDGRIAEQGTHGELMKLGRKYADLFRIQSAYYQEEAEVCQ